MARHDFDPTSIAGLLEDNETNMANMDDGFTPSVMEPVNLNAGPEVNIGEVYQQLSTLITTGNSILEAAQYLVQSAPDPENITSTASLLNSVKDVLKEFRLIHSDKLRRDHLIELEKLKISGRKEVVELKAAKVKELNNPGGNSTTTQNLVAFTQEEIVNQIADREDKKKQGIIDAEIVDDDPVNPPENS